MNIGGKIRELRKAKGLTQEQLANSIGISFQAVSKWENGLALPDITLAPVLAGYFGVSIDELFDFNLEKVTAQIEEITAEAYKFRESDPQRSRQILEEGLRRFPDNDILQVNLLYVINYFEHPDETIAIASNVIANTLREEVRYDALRFLAYAYKVKGDIDSAKAAIEQIPELYFTKLTEIAFLMDGKPKYDAASKQKMISFEDLLQMMEKIAEYYEESGNISKAIEEIDKAAKLIPIINHPSFDIYADYFEKRLENLKTKL